jgi:hypothetical protein
MLNSIYYLFGYNSSTSTSHVNNISANKICINAAELKSIKLKKISENTNNQPAFARNANIDEFNLSKTQLNEILNTKLKHTTPNKKQTYLGTRTSCFKRIN